MTFGVDTSFLVGFEITEHAAHRRCRSTAVRLVQNGQGFALTPQVLAEFVHVVSDGKRFQSPIPTSDAIVLARRWWNAAETKRLIPSDAAVQRFLAWHHDLGLGRKRVLDTLLAATFRESDVRQILTLNPSDFDVFGEFECVEIE